MFLTFRKGDIKGPGGPTLVILFLYLIDNGEQELPASFYPIIKYY